MIRPFMVSILVISALFIPAIGHTGEKGVKNTVKDIKTLPEREQTAIALSAAPATLPKKRA